MLQLALRLSPVTWDSAQAVESVGGSSLSFSIILYENSRDVDVVNGTMVASLGVGTRATIAVQNKLGHKATTYSCNQNVALAGTTIRFTAVAPT
jgi:hypothetical protein